MVGFGYEVVLVRKGVDRVLIVWLGMNLLKGMLCSVVMMCVDVWLLL